MFAPVETPNPQLHGWVSISTLCELARLITSSLDFEKSRTLGSPNFGAESS